MLIYYKLLVSFSYVQILLTIVHFVMKVPNLVDSPMREKSPMRVPSINLCVYNLIKLIVSYSKQTGTRYSISRIWPYLLYRNSDLQTSFQLLFWTYFPKTFLVDHFKTGAFAAGICMIHSWSQLSAIYRCFDKDGNMVFWHKDHPYYARWLPVHLRNECVDKESCQYFNTVWKRGLDSEKSDRESFQLLQLIMLTNRTTQWPTQKVEQLDWLRILVHYEAGWFWDQRQPQLSMNLKQVSESKRRTNHPMQSIMRKLQVLSWHLLRMWVSGCPCPCPWQQGHCSSQSCDGSKAGGSAWWWTV